MKRTVMINGKKYSLTNESTSSTFDGCKSVAEGIKEHQKALLKEGFDAGSNRGQLYFSDDFEKWYSKVYENPNKKSQ